jgi:hypothetical protein
MRRSDCRGKIQDERKTFPVRISRIMHIVVGETSSDTQKKKVVNHNIIVR